VAARAGELPPGRLLIHSRGAGVGATARGRGTVRAVPAERFHVAVAVYGVLLDGDHVLLLRRAGSGYRDGELSLPAGHLDGAEDAVCGLVRELREEVEIEADPGSCRLAVVLHRAAEWIGDDEYLDLIFTVGAWTGTPSIGEPDKCSELVWAPLDRLPGDVADYIRGALRGLRNGQPLVLVGWPGSEALGTAESGRAATPNPPPDPAAPGGFEHHPLGQTIPT
jgi:8-oxo-dGTP diphosphatase